MSRISQTAILLEYLWIFVSLLQSRLEFHGLRKFVLSYICNLPFLSLVMETNSFTRIKLHTSILNLKLKNGLLSEPFTLIWGVRQGCTFSYCYMLLWLGYLPFPLMLRQGLNKSKNHNHMRYSSWDTKWDRIFCHFGSFFALLTSSPLTTQKTKILKK